MIAVPPAKPVTIPVDPTIAIDGALLLHTPPGVTSDKGWGYPMHINDAPVTGPGVWAYVAIQENRANRERMQYFIKSSFICLCT